MRSAKYIAFWVGIISVVAILYDGARNLPFSGFGKTAAAISDVPIVKDGGVVFRKSGDGHFYILAAINGENITFLVDTGATDVVLSEKDAKKIGAHMRPVQQSKTYHTANGAIKATYFHIPEIRIGTLVARNVGASISKSELRTSLLGMSFLKHFHFTMRNDELLLSPS
ncbi:retropepsin-like aspartic protease family protein [Anaplasma capra]|uniref:retropepsin-like aspartic protease family protein n=1 Tax=Anaplasma capra TaxID=1562740 RepID=UPI0021D594E8|nr:TIGR02281 family clan AA aspartic protease [Anaplasma capra]MCU7611528.1 TIGR02281 family clan AA aspartic protease [Anaplasma capra]MCU7612033.1 TIGR02281 family clan AA aspartic protease [Anaplasma capra]